MLTAEARRRLTVVLVGARNPQNIGAAARALQDFGFRDLRVINQFAPPFEAAQLEAKSAVGAGEVMRSAQLFSSLPEAIADCTLVAGTTAIGERGLRLPVHSLRDAAPHLLEHLGDTSSPLENATRETAQPLTQQTPSQLQASQLTAQQNPSTPEAAQPIAQPEPDIPEPSRVALLFGSEKTGLTNEQLSHCSLLLTIPLFAPEGRHLSMNLGQSVAVCLYELSREGFEGARALPVPTAPTATAADRERLTALLHELMQRSDYARRFPANARLEIVRQLAGSLGKSREEAGTWMGLFKLVLRTLGADLDSDKPNDPS